MTNNSSLESVIALPPGADDLTRIRGISPKIANRLHESGILTFAKLAAMSPKEIAGRIGTSSGVSAEIIAKKDWIGQALSLASRPAPPTLQDESVTTDAGLSEMSYVIGIVVDEHQRVCRTKVLDVGSNEVDTWDGWDEAQLCSYFANRPGLAIQTSKRVSPTAVSITSSSPLAATTGTRPQFTSTTPARTETAEASNSPATNGVLAGVPRIRTIEMVRLDDNLPSLLLACNQRFNVRLALDLSDVTALKEGPFDYSAIVQAKKLDGGERQVVGEMSGMINLTKSVTLDLEGRALPAGIYRLHATVTLGPPAESSTPRQYLMAKREGCFLRVY
jgi:hypothetical protein